MITCPVCQTENDHLTIVCTKCGSYLQTRVDNLDLFTTSWNVLEKPFKTFHTIAIARHKNYMLVLSAIAGFAITFFLFWSIKASDYSESLLNILIAGIITGPFIGLATVFLFSAILKILGLLLLADAGYKQISAVTAYALVPVIISLFLVLPIELLTFGTFFFSKNPSPFMVKPISYSVLVGLDGLFALWSIILMIIGMKVIYGSRWMRAVLAVGISLLILSLCTGLLILRFIS